LSITIDELSDILKERLDPDLIVEILDISSEELVDRFTDLIEDRKETIIQYVEIERE